MQEVEEQLIKLVKGELLPEEWQTWWEANENQLMAHLSRGMWLKLKPLKHELRWVPILTSQKGAEKYLLSKGISFTRSDLYQQQYEAELEAYVQAKKKQDQGLLAQLKDQVPDLFRAYPKFAASLKHVYTSDDVLDIGASMETIEQAEGAIGAQLPQAIREHFQVVENLAIEGIRLELSGLYPIEIGKKNYIVLGEFWKEADGDLLLIKPETAEADVIYYYAHGYDKVKKLCSGIQALMENKFAHYNCQ